MNWKPAGLTFHGGTEEARALTGRRVRVRQRVSALRFLGVEDPFGPPIDLETGKIGFVGHPVRDMIILAFLDGNAPLPRDLKALTRGTFLSVYVNWPTFRASFDLEG